LYDYPAEQAALARKKPEDPRLAERFELYIAGIEIANAFSELADPVEQEQRLVDQQQIRINQGRRSWGSDRGLLEALREGIPPTGGIALGVDRLIMLFADTRDIQDVLLFPQREWF
jgi:lysyl-tRNA synthetase class II